MNDQEQGAVGDDMFFRIFFIEPATKANRVQTPKPYVFFLASLFLPGIAASAQMWEGAPPEPEHATVARGLWYVGQPLMNLAAKVPDWPHRAYVTNTALSGTSEWRAVLIVEDKDIDSSELKSLACDTRDALREGLHARDRKHKREITPLVTVSLLEEKAVDDIRVRTYNVELMREVRLDLRAALAAAMVHEQMLFQRADRKKLKPWPGSENRSLAVRLAKGERLQVQWINDWGHYYLIKAVATAHPDSALHQRVANLDEVLVRLREDAP